MPFEDKNSIFVDMHEVPEKITSVASAIELAMPEGMFIIQRVQMLRHPDLGESLCYAVQTSWKTAARGRWRLYAFGFDAYRLCNALGTSSGYVGLSGLTGALQVHADGIVQRELDWARISGGRELPAGSGPALPAPSEL